MSGSPAKSRPPDEAEPVETVPDLQLLAWQDSAPRWPVTLDTKFNEGTDEYSELMKKKEAFTMKFPAAAQQTTTRSSRVAGRAGGLCDYAVDNGRQPIDISREISLPHVADSDFTESRPNLGSHQRRVLRCLGCCFRVQRLYFHVFAK